MVGRFSQREIYREIFLTRDFFIVLSAGVLGIGASILGRKEFLGGSMALTLCVAASGVINGGPIVIGSIRGILNKRFNVDELVTLALIGAFLLQDFFEAAVIAFIMRIGELVEEAVSGSARKEISALFDLTPERARVLSGEGSAEERPVEVVRRGDRIAVKPGERIPVDGTLVKGKTSVDESCLTGESLPVFKKEGEEVLSGTINGEGYFEMITGKSGRRLSRA